MPSNTAAWIDSPYADLTVREAPLPVAGASQLVVRVRAVAVNPLDAITQSNGRLMYRWLTYPVVLGEDVAGEVMSVGSAVTRFRPGDRVVAYAIGMEKGRDHVGEGGFQHVVAVEEVLTAALPAGMTFAEAAVLPLAVSTAAAALIQEDQLGLAHPDPRGSDRRGQTVVVWGGSTSVGSNAVQLAQNAGYTVISTASPRNHEALRALGAAHVFDYRDSDVVAKIAAAAAGSEVVGVVAVATGSSEPSVAVAIATGAKRVALTSPSVSFFDQPRQAGLSLRRLRILTRLVSSNVALQLRCLRHGVRARFVWASTILGNEVGRMLWEGYLPVALAEGRHRPAPRAEVVGSGLDAVQPALDRLRGGVSATKLVVTLD